MKDTDNINPGGPIAPRSGEHYVPPQEEHIDITVPEDTLQYRKKEDEEFGQVRFLNASTSSLPLNILIDNHIFAGAVEFAAVTPYGKVNDGFRMVTISSALNPRMIFYRKSIPFVKGEPITMVIVDDINDVDLVLVSDKASTNLSPGTGCFRAANMSYGEDAYDVMFYSGDTVFANVRFKETTFFKEAMEEQYEFFIAKSVNGMERIELPIIEKLQPPFEMGISQPLYWFPVDIKAERRYTAYIIGNQWSLESLRVVVLEN